MTAEAQCISASEEAGPSNRDAEAECTVEEERAKRYKEKMERIRKVVQAAKDKRAKAKGIYEQIFRAHRRAGRTECEICHQTFSKKYHMQRHVRTVHESTYPAICNICGEKFRDNYSVKVHKRATHYLFYTSDQEAEAENRFKELPEGVTAYQALYRAKESERERESAREKRAKERETGKETAREKRAKERETGKETAREKRAKERETERERESAREKRAKAREKGKETAREMARESAQESAPTQQPKDEIS